MFYVLDSKEKIKFHVVKKQKSLFFSHFVIYKKKCVTLLQDFVCIFTECKKSKFTKPLLLLNDKKLSQC